MVMMNLIFLICNFLIIMFDLLHVYYFMIDVSSSKWAIDAGRDNCDLCGKQFGSSYELKLHVIGIVQADIILALHVMFSMMDPHVSTWWPQIEWACPPPCCKRSRWLDENTVQHLMLLMKLIKGLLSLVMILFINHYWRAYHTYIT